MISIFNYSLYIVFTGAWGMDFVFTALEFNTFQWKKIIFYNTAVF